MKLPRSRALVVAGLAGVTTLMAGSAVLVAGAQAGSGAALNAGRDATQVTTVVTDVQYDDTYAVVPGPNADDGSDGSVGSVGSDQVDSTTDATATDATEASANDPATIPSADHQVDDATTGAQPEPEHGHESGSPSTTVTNPSPTATVAAPPTTEGHDGHDGSGEVEGADDGAAAQPAQPMPAGCVHPQLEDDGRWNCDH